jgi:hypothetical protein
MSGYKVDILNHIYYSIGYDIQNGTVPVYSTSDEDGGTEQKITDIVPNMTIAPTIIDKTRQEAIDKGKGYCIYYHTMQMPITSQQYGGAHIQEFLWELDIYCGSNDLFVRNTVEGWFSMYLKDRVIPIYEFLQDPVTHRVVKSNEKIGKMQLYDVRVMSPGAITELEGEEGFILVNFVGRVTKALTV